MSHVSPKVSLANARTQQRVRHRAAAWRQQGPLSDCAITSYLTRPHRFNWGFNISLQKLRSTPVHSESSTLHYIGCNKHNSQRRSWNLQFNPTRTAPSPSHFILTRSMSNKCMTFSPLGKRFLALSVPAKLCGRGSKFGEIMCTHCLIFACMTWTESAYK